jgi:hypothetical protein
MVVVLLGFALWRGYQKSDISRTEKQLAIEACIESGDSTECRERIEVHHQACFDYNFSGAAIYGSSRLDRNNYRECLESGFENYIVDVRAREREAHALKNKLLN